ncbi:hypothetical protein CMI37_09845 [Candidatus Pacearchaeota archaeon]|nr:hypothetical protein [Candidatus Pacearchaeota archaeon]
MKTCCNIGDLVHIPQAVTLIDGDMISMRPQLTIPFRLLETKQPQIGVVTCVSRDGYIQVYSQGEYWSVLGDRVYRMNE